MGHVLYQRVQYFGGIFLRARQGIAVVEFALALPVLMTLFYGTVEVTRYILITQKVDKLAHSVADMASQEQVATKASLDQVMAAGSDVMNPFTISTNGKIIISALYRAPSATGPTVIWRYEGGGAYSATSQLGLVDGPAITPGGFTFDDRENVIAAEVYYQFSPLVSSQFFGTTTVYRVAFYKPRLGALLTAPV